MADEIYALIPEERLHGVLETLHAFTGLPLQLLGGGGQVLRAYGEGVGYCALLKKMLFSQESCQALHHQAGRRAHATGAAYIYTCHANLNHVAFALASQQAHLGTVVVGPFLMDKPDSTIISSVADSQELTPTQALGLYDELFGLKVIPPQQVQHLSKLIEYLLSPLLPAERVLMMQSQEKLYQQSRINETIQVYKEQGAAHGRSGAYERETALLAKVRTGNVEAAKAVLNDLLGYVLFSEGGKLDAVRTRAIELTALLSRVAVDGGARADSIYELSEKFLALIAKDQSLESLCYRLQDVVESFMSAMFDRTSDDAHIRQALRYMGDHYSQPLTLQGVAEQVGLSPNYFSALFRRKVGVSFREQLCRIRVEESKRLLLNADYSLTDIAVAMGFADQSYYCKTFKRIVGITPGKFRQ